MFILLTGIASHAADNVAAEAADGSDAPNLYILIILLLTSGFFWYPVFEGVKLWLSTL